MGSSLLGRNRRLERIYACCGLHAATHSEVTTLEGHVPVFTVLGAGAGGQALAGHLALRGHDVRLWNRSPGPIARLQMGAYLEIRGRIRGRVRLPVVTTDLAEAVEAAAVLMVVLPATAHHQLAERLAPLLEDGQVIVLNPGRTGGALEVRNVLEAAGCEARVLVAEAQTLVFASRIVETGVCHVFSVKRAVKLAALPAGDTLGVLDAVSDPFPQFVPAAHVLETSLGNIGAVFHPGVALLNASRIEATGGMFDYYHEGITPSVARIMRCIDSERLAVAEAFGVRVLSAREWLAAAYGVEAETLRQAIMLNPGYTGIKAPPHLNHRYIREDVPTSLVPVSELGSIAGLSTPTIDGVIALSSALHDTDYRALGRNARRMGIEGLDGDEVLELALGGAAERRKGVVRLIDGHRAGREH